MGAHTNSTERLTRFTLEFSFSIPKAGAAHHLAILSLPVPLLPNLVVNSIVMAPLWRRQRNKDQDLSRHAAGGRQLGIVSGRAGERIFPAHLSPKEEMGSVPAVFNC